MTVTPRVRVLGRATSATVPGWQVQSSAVADADGGVISRAGYRADGWYAAPARSTVMAAVLAAGEYPDVLRSTRMRDVDASRFRVPWWYRTLFDITAGGRTLLRLEGVIHRAELWVNGRRVAGDDEIAGAYPVTTVDVTDSVHPGTNAMALLVMPGHPETDLSIGWIDWNPAPPDTNMGVWRDVHVLRTGEVRLADPYVVTERIDPSGTARLRVGVDIASDAAEPRSVTVTGTLARLDAAEPERRFRVDVPVAPGPARQVTVDATDVPELAVEGAALWWPVGHGAQPRYELRLEAVVDGALSDQAVTTFGIRQVESTIEPGGGRRFSVNGRPIQILGAGWCPDIFLRDDPRRVADQLAAVIDLGLNAIRLEGKLENPDLFELADRLGIMVLPGWECCTKWESHAGTGSAPWTERDYRIARRSMAGQARLLRGHPSVICFLIGSDFAPPESLAEIYVEELRAADWATPVVSSASSKWNNEVPGDPDADTRPDTSTTRVAGPSGMKMWPYDWVPPVYWYQTRYGGAVGFDSECSAGHSVPRLPSLRRMLTPAELETLWQRPDAHFSHAAPRAPISTLAIFHAALAGRYGPIGGLRDFLRKAELAAYEAARAQFEAYGSRFHAEQPATGVIYWMLTSAWPSLTWQLFDYYLEPTGSYFGAKKANEPLHVQLAPDTGAVQVVNHTPRPAGACVVRATVRNIDGTPVASWRCDVASVPAGGAAVAGAVTVPDGLAPTYFVELELSSPQADGGPERPISRNVYWLSTTPDTLDWARTTWQHTPQLGYADLTGLSGIPTAVLDVTAVELAAAPGEEAAIAVTVRNPGPHPAVGVHLSLSDGGAPIAPVRWQDNDITLFAGQVAAVTVRYPRADPPRRPLVEVDGFNVTDLALRPAPAPPPPPGSGR